MWAVGSLGILKNPDTIYADKNNQNNYDVYAENNNFRILLEEDIKKSDLKKIMLRIDFSLQKQELQNGN